MTMNYSFLENEKQSVLTLSPIIRPHTLPSLFRIKHFPPTELDNEQETSVNQIYILCPSNGSRQRFESEILMAECWVCI